MQKHLHSLKIACNESIEKDLTNMIFATVPSSYLTFRITFLYLLKRSNDYFRLPFTKKYQNYSIQICFLYTAFSE